MGPIRAVNGACSACVLWSPDYPVFLHAETLATQDGSMWSHLPFLLDLSPEIPMWAVLTQAKIC